MPLKFQCPYNRIRGERIKLISNKMNHHSLRYCCAKNHFNFFLFFVQQMVGQIKIWKTIFLVTCLISKSHIWVRYFSTFDNGGVRHSLLDNGLCYDSFMHLTNEFEFYYIYIYMHSYALTKKFIASFWNIIRFITWI